MMMECVGAVCAAEYRFAEKDRNPGEYFLSVFFHFTHQIDPCWGPRNILKLCCAFIPCGCIAEETITFVCCCNPGNESEEPNGNQKQILLELQSLLRRCASPPRDSTGPKELVRKVENFIMQIYLRFDLDLHQMSPIDN